MYFPLFLNISGARFLIIGAGQIAIAKLETILEFSKNISVIAKEISPENSEFIKGQNIEFILGLYDKKYLANADIIIAATHDKKVNQQIADDAKALGKLVNVVDDPKNSRFIFGANIKRGEIILSAATSGVSPVLSRLLKQKLQNFLPENFSYLSDFLAKNKDLVKEKLNEIQARRLFWQETIEGPIANEILLGNFSKAQNLLETKLQNFGNKKEAAVYFISAGPGDPELITVKAINLLSKADVVLYDRLVSPEILNYARKDALKINVGKTRDLHRYAQEEINQLLRKYAIEGNIVARLKGGDAGIFGRLSEEIDAIIDLKVPYQIVPGITAASGAAAYAGIPLTSRNSNKSVRFLTIYKHDLVDENYFKELAQSDDSLVLYMSSHNLGEVANKLVAAGKNSQTPLAIIEQATTIYQKTFTSTLENFSADFGDKKFVSPSLVIIGDIVSQHHLYRWREENLSGSYFKKLEERT
jgi:uroporphyrin-III C-methyltransferase/precorrin-2 dehydrogenase/sirohydrochlorin ferrochelatase